ncbi:MAG: hypothetical protein K2H31_10745, partial [Lachnospiraceae bacterium]|nr:hypothetical protein [Lachnospiraceae bacterium]
MTNLYNITATIDERLQIIRGDKNFYEYIGFDHFVSLAENIHPEDVEHLKQIIAHLSLNDPAM